MFIPTGLSWNKGYSYTSTPSMGRKACTEPQCLCKSALGYPGTAQYHFLKDSTFMVT